MKTANSRWLDAARKTDDPAGDLIEDMRNDYHGDPAIFPSLFPNIDAMRAFLIRRHACIEALAAVKIVWRRYKSWLDQNPC